MRRSEEGTIAYGILAVLTVALALAFLNSCTGYFAPGGAALYCKDRHGKAIRCPAERDSTKEDTTHTER